MSLSSTVENFHSLALCRDLFNNDLTALPPGIFDSLSLLTFLCVTFGTPRRASFLFFFSFPFVFLSASTSPGCHTLSTRCDWSIYTVNFVVSVFHWVFRLASSFEIRVLCSPFLEWRLQAQPQVVAGYFHPSLLLQASEWKWPNRAAGRHLRLVVSTEFPVRACGKKACSCLLGSVLWSNCIFFGREKRKGGNCPRSRCLFNQYYPLMAIFRLLAMYSAQAGLESTICWLCSDTITMRTTIVSSSSADL